MGILFSILILIIPYVFFSLSVFREFLWYYWALPVFILSLYGLSRKLKTGLWSIVLIISLGLILFLAFLLLSLAMKITPASAFLAWKFYLSQRPMGGMIGHLVLLYTMFFSTLFGLYSLWSNNGLRGFLMSMAFHGLSVYLLWGNPLALLLFIPIMLFHSISRILALKKVDRPAGRIILVLPFVLTLLVVILANTVEKSHRSWIPRIPISDLHGKVAALWPDFPFLKSQPGYGYRMNSEVSARVPFLTGQAFFRLTGVPNSFYRIKMETFDDFTGEIWRNAEKKQALTSEAMAESSSPAKSIIELEILTDFTNTLPQIYGYSLIKESLPTGTILRGTASQGFFLEPPLWKDYHLTYIYGSTALMDTPTRQQLQLPDLDLAVLTIPPDLDSRSKADFIIQYLRGNYIYSLSKQKEKKGTLFLSTFQESKKGYCIHFATLFTLLARREGIPARYVSGFVVQMPPNSPESLVTGYSAHSWPEIWIEEEGWIPVEPTPPIADLGEGILPNIEGMDRVTQTQMNRLLSDGESFEKGKRRLFSVFVNKNISTLLFSSVFLLVIFVVIYRVNKVHSLNGIMLRIEEKGYQKTGKRANQDGWSSWGLAFSKQLTHKAYLPIRISALWIGYAFGDRRMTQGDKRFIRLAVRYLVRQ